MSGCWARCSGAQGGAAGGPACAALCADGPLPGRECDLGAAAGGAQCAMDPRAVAPSVVHFPDVRIPQVKYALREAVHPVH